MDNLNPTPYIFSQIFSKPNITQNKIQYFILYFWPTCTQKVVVGGASSKAAGHGVLPSKCFFGGSNFQTPISHDVFVPKWIDKKKIYSHSNYASIPF